MNAIPDELAQLLARSPLKPLRLRGRTLLPIFQGGMGVGVSGHRLAGTVARWGGVGTPSAFSWAAFMVTAIVGEGFTRASVSDRNGI